MRHELKCEAEFFDAVERGDKTFEIRRNDRNYQVGDTILLRRTADGNPYPYDQNGHFHGPLSFRITYMTDYAQKRGFVVLGIKQQPHD